MLESLNRLWVEKKTLVIIIIIIALVFSFGGIAFFLLSNQKQPTVVASPEVSLTWWKADTADGVYDDIIKDFQAIAGNEKVKINIVNKTINNDYYKGLIADLARGISPDILTLQNNDLPAYKVFLAPINEFNGSTLTNYRNDFVNQVVRETMDKDKVFCVSNYVDTLQLFYNEDLLKQSQIPRPATTWKELDSQIPFLRKIPIRGDEFLVSPIALGIGGRSLEGKSSNIENVGDIIAALIYQYDGLIYDYQNERVALGQGVFDPNLKSTVPKVNLSESNLDVDSPSFDAIEFYNSFADINSSRYSWNKSNPNAIEMFAQGRLVYNINYQSFYDNLKKINPRINIKVAPLPQQGSGTKKTFGRFNMDCLNSKLKENSANSLDRKAIDKYQKAQEFMTFLATKDVQIKISNKTKLPAAHKDAIALQLEGDLSSSVFANGALNSDGYYQPDVNLVEQMWLDLFEKVQYNNVSLKQATEDTIKIYTQSINSGPKLRA